VPDQSTRKRASIQIHRKCHFPKCATRKTMRSK
jgi:hypothetical protein